MQHKIYFCHIYDDADDIILLIQKLSLLYLVLTWLFQQI